MQPCLTPEVVEILDDSRPLLIFGKVIESQGHIYFLCTALVTYTYAETSPLAFISPGLRCSSFAVELII